MPKINAVVGEKSVQTRHEEHVAQILDDMDNGNIIHSQEAITKVMQVWESEGFDIHMLVSDMIHLMERQNKGLPKNKHCSFGDMLYTMWHCSVKNGNSNN